MDSKLILGIDPGKSTGIALGRYGDDKPYELVKAWTTHDGIDGWLEWWNGMSFAGGVADFDTIVCEGFVLRDNGWLANLDGVEIIGSIKTLRPDVVIQLRGRKSLAPDSMLKANGLWQTGKMVGHTDGRDANDAIIHSLAFLIANEKHQPTIRAMIPDV